MRGARLPRGRARGAARPAGEAGAAAASRSASRSAPATSSRSPTSSTRSIPTSRASRSCCRASTPRRRSTSTSSPRSRWRTPSTTCSTRTPRIASIGRKAAEAASTAAAGARHVDLALLVHERELELLRALAAYPEVWSPRRPRSARRTGSPRGCATSPSAFHGFYRDCRVITDDAALTQARLWLAEACRHRARQRARPSSACTRPTR